MEYTNPNMNLTPEQDIDKGKIAAILSYCTLLGWIVGLVLHQNDKTKFGAYHLRQGLGLILAWLAVVIVISITSPLFGFFTLTLLPLLWIAVLVFIILGIINASGGKMKGLPLIGALAEKWFAGIK